MNERFVLQGITFEWNREKAHENQRKHGTDFETASDVFFDPFLRVEDASATAAEQRQAVLGMTAAWRLLYVVFIERSDLLRIISARPATAAERKRYEDG